MTQLLSNAEGRALLTQQKGGKKGQKHAQNRTKGVESGKRTTQHKTTPENDANEPVEKHVRLPPPPADCGPWPIGDWELRRATAYAPDCRMTLHGPAADFDRFFAYLQAYQP